MAHNSVSGRLIGSEIHGFRTMDDLDVANMMEEAKARWLRPNEIHAILCNSSYFTVHVKPVTLPKSGTIVLFDRKKLRNFRKDGHIWKKKKDGKTVKEAHEHLKVGNEERIHVYYAHGEDNTTFVRRCYWLLDKSLEHIVLVHYRETQEVPATPVNSNSNSAASDPPTSWPLSEDSDAAVDRVYHGVSQSLLERGDIMTIENHEQRLHEINTLDWDELVVPDDPNKRSSPQEVTGNTACFQLPNQYQMHNYRISDDAQSTTKVSPESSGNGFSEQVVGSNYVNYNAPNNLSYQTMGGETIGNSEAMVSGLVPLGGGGSLCNLGMRTQDSFGRWISYAVADSPESVGDQNLDSSILTGNQSSTYPMFNNHHPPQLGQIFNITDISPTLGSSTEETKVLIVGGFCEGYLPHPESKVYIACGNSILAAESVQAGVFRCLISPQDPGFVDLYMTFDGHKPISQVLTFEFRGPAQPKGLVLSEDERNWQEFQLQMRLAHLLFSSSTDLSIYSTIISHTALKEANVFAKRTSHIFDSWVYLSKMIEDTQMSFPQAKDRLFELTLQSRLQEWLLEKVVSGCKLPPRDEQGQGVIHLCAILGYTWAVYPFSWSGLSLDYRDKFGWTAMHWAAYYGRSPSKVVCMGVCKTPSRCPLTKTYLPSLSHVGRKSSEGKYVSFCREKMVAILLSAGAKPNLVTDPTAQNPGGLTAADLASRNGYEGLAAYLAEKALVTQFKDMTLAGNVSGSLQSNTNETIANPANFTDEELNLKDTLAAYRTAADAAARIQAAFREHSFNVRTKEVESANPEMEARNIIAAMKIQHAFRNYETRKQMVAAARIQYRFRAWKTRRTFLNMRRQAIKIQASFRGYKVRRQYRKICWSVGIVEKAILRWRLRRKGFRGLQVQCDTTPKDPNQDSDVEEDFFKASRKQAEERVERSVVRVQAMFRSKRAQEEYRRMKLEHNKASLEYEGLSHLILK